MAKVESTDYNPFYGVVPAARTNFTKAIDGDLAACSAACDADTQCKGFTVDGGLDTCWLYDSVQSLVVSFIHLGGVRIRCIGFLSESFFYFSFSRFFIFYYLYHVF